jgi:hypothetical protein
MTERLLDADDVILLLRSDIEHAGGIVAWSKKERYPSKYRKQGPAQVRPPTKRIIKVLKLRAVWVQERK